MGIVYCIRNKDISYWHSFLLDTDIHLDLYQVHIALAHPMEQDGSHLLALFPLELAKLKSEPDSIKALALVQVHQMVEVLQVAGPRLEVATVVELDMVFVGQRDDYNLVDFAFVP